jgi:hypothetical protein
VDLRASLADWTPRALGVGDSVDGDEAPSEASQTLLAAADRTAKRGGRAVGRDAAADRSGISEPKVTTVEWGADGVIAEYDGYKRDPVRPLAVPALAAEARKKRKKRKKRGKTVMR